MDYLQNISNSTDACVQIAFYVVIFIIIILIAKFLINNYFVEKFDLAASLKQNISNISTDGRCGSQGGNKICQTGQCCSKWGYCGSTLDHCKTSGMNPSQSNFNGANTPNEQCFNSLAYLNNQKFQLNNNNDANIYGSYANYLQNPANNCVKSSFNRAAFNEAFGILKNSSQNLDNRKKALNSIKLNFNNNKNFS